MKICVVGAGYVGLVSGACLAEIGHNVVCVDKNLARIESLRQGRMPNHEPGLAEMVEANTAAGRLAFTGDVMDAVKDGCDLVFLAVGTPSHPATSHADLTFVAEAATEAAAALAAHRAALKAQGREAGIVVVVTKSTVPVGTSREVASIVGRFIPAGAFAVASNPEFLREGNAIEDFMRPDRIVIGTESPFARKVLEDLYRPITRQGRPLVVTSTVETAELVKYAANAFLATKITFINEIARLCEKVHAQVDEVALALGLDKRIGERFLNAGPGYGGSCIPKDALALMRTANDFGSPLEIIETVVRANERHMHFMINKVRQALGGHAGDCRIGVLGLAFKANTDDMRESPSLTILPALHYDGARIVAHDPEASANAAPMLPYVRMAASPAEVFDGADAVLILTEWDQYSALPWADLKHRMAAPVVIDLRNLLDPGEMSALGYSYTSVGRLPGASLAARSEVGVA